MRPLAVVGLLVSLVGLLEMPAFSQPVEHDMSQGVLLFFRSPSATEPALGSVNVEVEVFGDGPAQVVFLVDGEERDRVESPPFRVAIDLGDQFGPHTFEVVVLDSRGAELARATRETPGLMVDDRVQLDLRQLYVTVTPPGGAAVHLQRDEFEVRDEGVEQDLVTFEGGDAALTVALLVDASESMRGGRLEAALAGAHAFLSGMNELDEASVTLFSDLIEFQTPVTQQSSALAGQLNSVEARGGTALNDTLFVALGQLERRQGRRVVVLLSDGFDIHSVLSISDVLWSMRRSRSLIYWIELTGGRENLGITSPWRDSASHAEEKDGLRRLVEESGGSVVQIEQVEQATAAFEDILAELREQYVLGYYPTVKLFEGQWHRVCVKVQRAGFKVRTRGGYVD
jgi:Ca-activated chloride channel family protein